MPGAKKSFTFQDVRKATKSTEDARRMTVDAGEGLRLVLTTLGDLTEGRVQITAEATNDAAKDQGKADRLEGRGLRFPSAFQSGRDPWLDHHGSDRRTKELSRVGIAPFVGAGDFAHPTRRQAVLITPKTPAPS